MYEHIGSSDHKARKKYQCDDCNTSIFPGTQYRRVFFKFDGDPCTTHFHLDCLTASSEIYDYLEGDEGRWFLREGLVEVFDEQDCLKALRVLAVKHPAVYSRIEGEALQNKVIKRIEQNGLKVQLKIGEIEFSVEST